MQKSYEIKDFFIKSEEINILKNGVSVYHIVKSLLDNHLNFLKAVKSSVLFFDKFENSINENIQNFKLKKDEKRVSNELKSILYQIKDNNLNLLILKILETKSIKKILIKNAATPEEVILNLNKLENNKHNYKDIKIFKKYDNSLINLNEKILNSDKKRMVGRNEELNKIIETIQRKNNNSPIIVGHSGVGKTTIIENLVLSIIEGDVPTFLKDTVIMELNIAELLIETHLQGSLEKKINELILNINSQDQKIILYIDEIERILKTRNKSNTTSISELLRPSIENGTLICIASISSCNLKTFENDLSFSRFFEVIDIKEPNKAETLSILRCLKKEFENHYEIKIDDNALIKAVDLSERYITDKYFPEKAINLIDEASSYLKTALLSKPHKILKIENTIKQKLLEKSLIIDIISNNEDNEDNINKIEKEILFLEDELLIIEDEFKKELEIQKNKNILLRKIKEFQNQDDLNLNNIKLKKINEMDFFILKTKVTENEISEMIARKTGLPLNKITETDKNKILKLEDRLSKNVIGQSLAIKQISSSIRRSQVGLSDSTQPIGSFLFLGSTGVGKTELCKQLAIELFDSENDLIRFDMSEFMEKHTVSQLIGSPIGYEGSNEGGKLTNAVKRKPYSVVLFDEIEKAHPDVLNLLLQILDDGRLTDSRGELINFRNTIIILTTNIGSRHINKNMSERNKNKVMQDLEAEMKPELINRIDEKIIFDKLTLEGMESICEIILKNLTKKLLDLKISIEFENETIKYLSKQSLDPKYGARPLKRMIKNLIEDNLAINILNNNIKKGDEISILLNKKGFKILKTKGLKK